MSCLNCSTALRKSRISARSYLKNSETSFSSASRVRHRAAQHLLPVLDQNRRFRILEDDVVLRIALRQLLADFLVEIVGRVLGFPVAEGHAQIVEDRAVGADAVLLRR